MALRENTRRKKVYGQSRVLPKTVSRGSDRHMRVYSFYPQPKLGDVPDPTPTPTVAGPCIWLDPAGEVEVINTNASSADERYGSSIAISGSWLAVGAYEMISHEENWGGTYIFNYVDSTSTWTQTQVLTGNHNNSEFGIACDIYDDYLCIGAQTDIVLSGAGAFADGQVHVYKRSSENIWEFQTYLTGTAQGGLAEKFGHSLEIDRVTPTRLAVGGYCGTSGYPGTVHILTRTGDFWTKTRITGSYGNFQANAYAGRDVSLHGTTLAVGEPNNHVNNVDDVGVCHLFEHDDTYGWQVSQLFSGSGLNEKFGSSCAVSGNLLAISAPNIGLQGQLQVYTRTAPGEIWNLKQTISGTSGEGLSLGLTKNLSILNNTIVYGDVLRDSEAVANSGRITTLYAEDWNTSTIISSSLNAPDPVASGYFGYSIAFDGNNVAVGEVEGAPGESEVQSGTAWVFPCTDEEV